MLLRPLLDVCRTIDLFNRIAVFIHSASHHVFSHLKLQAAVISSQPLGLSIFVLCHHQRRVTFIPYHSRPSLLGKLLKHFVLGEEIVIQSLCSCDSLTGILLEKSFHQIKPLIDSNVHDSGRF